MSNSNSTSNNSTLTKLQQMRLDQAELSQSSIETQTSSLHTNTTEKEISSLNSPMDDFIGSLPSGQFISKGNNYINTIDKSIYKGRVSIDNSDTNDEIVKRCYSLVDISFYSEIQQKYYIYQTIKINT